MFIVKLRISQYYAPSYMWSFGNSNTNDEDSLKAHRPFNYASKFLIPVGPRIKWIIMGKSIKTIHPDGKHTDHLQKHKQDIQDLQTRLEIYEKAHSTKY